MASLRCDHVAGASYKTRGKLLRAATLALQSCAVTRVAVQKISVSSPPSPPKKNNLQTDYMRALQGCATLFLGRRSLGESKTWWFATPSPLPRHIILQPSTILHPSFHSFLYPHLRFFIPPSPSFPSSLHPPSFPIGVWARDGDAPPGERKKSGPLFCHSRKNYLKKHTKNSMNPIHRPLL